MSSMAKYTREAQCYGLRPSRKPQEGSSVAGVVVVTGCEGIQVANVRFASQFERAVGLALPHGVGPEHPAYLSVVKHARSDEWRVYALYLDGSYRRLLWVTKDRPKWLSKMRKVHHE